MAMVTNPVAVPGGYQTDPTITANGSFTLPRYTFIPHPSSRPLASGSIPWPSNGGVSAQFTASGLAQRPYPTPDFAGAVYGTRTSVQMKTRD